MRVDWRPFYANGIPKPRPFFGVPLRTEHKAIDNDDKVSLPFIHWVKLNRPLTRFLHNISAPGNVDKTSEKPWCLFLHTVTPLYASFRSYILAAYQRSSSKRFVQHCRSCRTSVKAGGSLWSKNTIETLLPANRNRDDQLYIAWWEWFWCQCPQTGRGPSNFRPDASILLREPNEASITASIEP